MNRFAVFAIMGFVFSNSVTAQKELVSIHWEIPAMLPDANGNGHAPGVAGAVSGVCGPVLVVAGGSNFPDGMPWQGGQKKYYDNAFVFGKKDRGMILLNKSFKLPHAVAYSANCSTPRGIVYAGGENARGISNKVMLLQWDAAAQGILVKALPSLPMPLTNAAMAACNNTVYLAGGEMDKDVSAGFYALNLDDTAAGWRQLPPLPQPVSHAVLAACWNGGHHCLYLIGGRKKNAGAPSNLYASVYEFDSEQNRWQEKKSLPYPLSAGTGLWAGQGLILVFGGDRGETFHRVETLIVAIELEKDETKKQELIRQKNKLLALHPGFSKEILLYDTAKNEWTAIDSMAFDVPVTTTATRWDETVIIPGGEIRAGVRTPQILAGKISFQ